MRILILPRLALAAIPLLHGILSLHGVLRSLVRMVSRAHHSVISQTRAWLKIVSAVHGIQTAKLRVRDLGIETWGAKLSQVEDGAYRPSGAVASTRQTPERPV